MQHNIRDPQRDHNHGRIYRVVNTAKPLQKPVSIDGEPINVLLNNLKHPIDGVRYRTRIELSEHPTDPLVEEINKWVSNFDAKNPTQAHHMLEALWVLQAHNVKDDKLMGTLLTSADPNVRRAAKTVQHFWYNVDFTRGGGELAKVKEDKAPEPKVVVQGNQTIVDIAAIPHQLKYNLNNFSVKAGSKVKITFLNPDVIPHNLLIVEPGSRAEIGNQAIAMGADAVKKAPKNSKILQGTKMLEAGQKETLEFTAPAKPGDYEFICTFPGHWAVMNGIMKVTK